ncbi:MAG: nickel pincer cofactor biosynthesis protein LarC [Candidatus Zixiibacteriota bacterium]
MRRALYIDGESGAAGDMLLAALIDLGIDATALAAALRPIVPSPFALYVEPVTTCGIAAKRLRVEVAAEAKHRTLAEVDDFLDRGDLSEGVRTRCRAIFQRLATAEATVHASTPQRVHFHEVGGNDALIDIIGVVWSLAELHIDAVYCAPLVLGSGVGRSAHGPIVYPAPAVMAILQGQPVQLVSGLGETTTPTAAAILAEVAEFSRQVMLTPERVGYGAGTHTFSDRPNLVRATLGHVDTPVDTDLLWLATSDIDNTRPEVFDWLADRLRAAGAVDVMISDVGMKKNRRGHRVEALCDAPSRAAIADVILTETGSLGVRWVPVWRTKLPREIVAIDTPWGAIRVKVARTAHGRRGIAEYDDCRVAAERAGEPLVKIIATVERLFDGSSARLGPEPKE